MFAVIATGGKQYLVKSGCVISIEKLNANVGDEVTFDAVLLVADEDGKEVTMGSPTIAGKTVKGIVKAQTRKKKVRVVKYKPKVRYKRVHGHRQHVTKVEIL